MPTADHTSYSCASAPIPENVSVALSHYNSGSYLSIGGYDRVAVEFARDLLARLERQQPRECIRPPAPSMCDPMNDPHSELS